MDKAPKMISGKDLNYIKDMLSWNLIASKKACHYLSHIQDNDVKQALEATANMHAEHYKTILNFLK